MAKVTIVEGMNVGHGYTIPEDAPLTVGRSPDNEIQVPDKKASRKHCQFERADKGYKVVDLGSHNGTLLNDTPIKGKLLTDGDLIRVCNTVFRFDEWAEEGDHDDEEIAVEEGKGQ